MKVRFMAVEKLNKEKVKDQWRNKYHLMPPVGFLNDPNGLCQVNDTYHISFQYSPAMDLKKGWGHYSTKDFVHYKQYEPLIVADSDYDKDGAYSGSAFVENNEIHYFYTGNIKLAGDYDYIYHGRVSNVIHCTSKDGIHLSKKELLLSNEDYPSDMTCHVRDPKIIKINDRYYMCLGARDKNSVGCVLIYESDDLMNWHYLSRITSKEPFGYMWECPDIFELDGRLVLMTCPQGIDYQENKYENIYENGYFLLDDIRKNQVVSNFHSLDRGSDFYAQQTFQDQNGRRILIGWMGLPETKYSDPCLENGWIHSLTLPRVLTLIENHIYQYPIAELRQLRNNHISIHLDKNETYDYKTNCVELHVKPHKQSFCIQLREDTVLSYENHIFSLTINQSGYGRTCKHIEIDHMDEITIFSDHSTLEIFINHGEYTMSSLIYDRKEHTNIEVTCSCDIDIYELNSFEIEEVSE